MSTLEGGSRESWPPSASIHPRLLGEPALAAAGNVRLLFEHLMYLLLQVFGLDKVGVISLLRKLTGAKHSIDREALWEAAETYHRLHQVPSSLTIGCTTTNILTQVELCAPGGGGALYGLALALTSLNLARHSLSRPRVQVNITS